MSETSAEIFKESLPMVSNPPKSTRRTPDEILADIKAQKLICQRFDAAMQAEGKHTRGTRRKAAGFAALRAVEFHLRTRVRLPQRQLIRSR
jgi:hypothetical protein